MEEGQPGQDIEATEVPHAHRRALIMKRRCAHCAEPVRAGVLLRGKPCPHCGRVSSWQHEGDAEQFIGALDAKWSRRRWWVYGILAVGAFATGMIPLAATALTILAMVYARFAIVRSPIQWFSPSRRFTARFTMRLWMLITGLMALVVNELLTLVPWANMPLKMIVSVFFTGLFVEGSLFFLKGRLRREASEDHGLQWWEWGLPAGLAGGAVALTTAAVGSVMLINEALTALYQTLIGWF